MHNLYLSPNSTRKKSSVENGVWRSVGSVTSPTPPLSNDDRYVLYIYVRGAPCLCDRVRYIHYIYVYGMIEWCSSRIWLPAESYLGENVSEDSRNWNLTRTEKWKTRFNKSRYVISSRYRFTRLAFVTSVSSCVCVNITRPLRDRLRLYVFFLSLRYFLYSYPW